MSLVSGHNWYRYDSKPVTHICHNHSGVFLGFAMIQFFRTTVVASIRCIDSMLTLCSDKVRSWCACIPLYPCLNVFALCSRHIIKALQCVLRIRSDRILSHHC